MCPINGSYLHAHNKIYIVRRKKAYKQHWNVSSWWYPIIVIIFPQRLEFTYVSLFLLLWLSECISSCCIIITFSTSTMTHVASCAHNLGRMSVPHSTSDQNASIITISLNPLYAIVSRMRCKQNNKINGTNRINEIPFCVSLTIFSLLRPYRTLYWYDHRPWVHSVRHWNSNASVVVVMASGDSRSLALWFTEYITNDANRMVTFKRW